MENKKMTNKERLIKLIRQHQWYEEGVLESMTEEELITKWNRLIDWIGD